MSETQLIERVAANAGRAPARPSTDFGEMQQDLLHALYDDQLLNDCYQQLSEAHRRLTRPEPEVVKRARDEIAKTVHTLRDGLKERRLDSSDGEWQEFVKLCLLHPLRDLVYQDPFTSRAYHKPRGYAGDAVLMDLIYGVDEGKEPPTGTSTLGREIFRHVVRFTVCEGVRMRRRMVAETIDRLALECHRPQILSVAAGHLREADITGALKQRRVGRWVALDSDPDSLQEVAQCYGAYGVETVAASVRQLIMRRLDLGAFDFIYSTGLYDYLQQPIGKRLTERMFEMLRPGGRLLIANLLPDVDARGLMESYMEWDLVYREPPEMLNLVMGLDRKHVRDIRLWAEDNDIVVFLQVSRK